MSKPYIPKNLGKICCLCEVNPIVVGAYDRIHEHHLDGHGVGDTVFVCQHHHTNFHGFANKEAIKIAEEKNPLFFREAFNKYKEEIAKKRRGLGII